ncbi:putative homing endonuclease [Yersinia phage phiR1-37]|uniref:homing endonuclease n=1 Tax=Yersinia phage phiR1-37 TaxID=331278 RepID=UPI00022DBD91|nr:homing endonuclease [Yersinia phage phiR1-37]CCE26253.1 putative homing endonuclease [Yersinia phage phiR1-37]
MQISKFDELTDGSSSKIYINNLNKFIDSFNECNINNEYSLSPTIKYKSVQDKIEVIHNKCKKSFLMTPTNLIAVRKKEIKTGCPHCRYKKAADTQRFSLETFVSKLEAKYPSVKDKMDFSLSKYKDTNTKIEVICKTTGKPFFIRPRELMMGNGSPHLHHQNKSNGDSKVENEIYMFIRKILPNDIEILKNVKGLLPSDKRKEIDIYIPSMKIGIEVNGIFWHSINKTNRARKKYHIFEKMEEAYDQGIRIYNIFDCEWARTRKKLKSRLKSLLQANSYKIFARKCAVKKITPKESNVFLDTYHMQGKCNASFNYGLFFEDELCAVITFSKTRKLLNRNDENTLELLRFASISDINIVGGFSKLLNFAIKDFKESNLNINSIISYANLRYSFGEVYIKNGFELTSVSNPGYWYTDKFYGQVFHRANFQKRLLSEKLENFDESLSEQQNMLNNGYGIIYDCGNLLFTLSI